MANNVVLDEKGLAVINKSTLKEMKADELFVFPVRLSDNEIDSSLEKMSVEFLNELVALINNEASNGNCVPIIRDHDRHNSDNIEARIYEAELVTSDTDVNKVGEPLNYIAGKAYTTLDNTGFISKVESGILKSGSPGFSNEHDICSICGNDMYSSGCGHELGAVYEDKVCYIIINGLISFDEWSLVAVPCQKDTGIKIKSNNKKKGVKTGMKKSTFALFKTKAFKEGTPETQEELKAAIEDTNAELSEDDIKDLIDENDKLKTKVQKLETEISDLKEAGRTEKISGALGTSVDELKPLNDKIKEVILSGIDTKSIELDDDGKIKGLDDLMAGIKENFKGCFIEEIVDTKSDKIEEEEDEGELKNKTKSKAKSNFGIGFGVGEKHKEKSQDDNKIRRRGQYGLQ